MGSKPVAEGSDQSGVLYQWSARRLQPVVIAYVAAVFVVFAALSYFVFHSMTAVKTLAMAAVAGIVSLVPAVLQRVEYRLTEVQLDRRTVAKDKAKGLEIVFRLDELNHIVPTGRGFKFYLQLNEPNPLRRFWKLHVSDEYSGDVHVETADRKCVMSTLERCGVSLR
jgi:hypothetical protein